MEDNIESLMSTHRDLLHHERVIREKLMRGEDDLFQEIKDHLCPLLGEWGLLILIHSEPSDYIVIHGPMLKRSRRYGLLAFIAPLWDERLDYLVRECTPRDTTLGGDWIPRKEWLWLSSPHSEGTDVRSIPFIPTPQEEGIYLWGPVTPSLRDAILGMGKDNLPLILECLPLYRVEEGILEEVLPL